MEASRCLCLVRGVALPRLVLRRRAPAGRRESVEGDVDVLRISDEAEWSSGCWADSRRASALPGECLTAESSAVFPWGRPKVRFRRKRPCRWRSLRFWGRRTGRVVEDKDKDGDEDSAIVGGNSRYNCNCNARRKGTEALAAAEGSFNCVGQSFKVKGAAFSPGLAWRILAITSKDLSRWVGTSVPVPTVPRLRDYPWMMPTVPPTKPLDENCNIIYLLIL